jgi:hypothetical protein
MIANRQNVQPADDDGLPSIVVIEWLLRNGFYVERGHDSKWFKREGVRVVFDDNAILVYGFDSHGINTFDARFIGAPVQSVTAFIKSVI